ncbi:MAG: hypothetical protein ACK4ND_07690, partial [Cytophagaceae bacterium]
MNAANTVLKIIFFGLIFTFSDCSSSYGQSFCFSKKIDKYTSLDEVNSLTDSLIWKDTSFYVPIGFSFNFRGKLYDSLTVESNGALYLKDFAKLASVLDEDGNITIRDTLPVISPFGEMFHQMKYIDRGFFTDISKSY